MHPPGWSHVRILLYGAETRAGGAPGAPPTGRTCNRKLRISSCNRPNSERPSLQPSLVSFSQATPDWLASRSSKRFRPSRGQRHAKCHYIVWEAHRQEMTANRLFIGSTTKNLLGASGGHIGGRYWIGPRQAELVRPAGVLECKMNHAQLFRARDSNQRRGQEDERQLECAHGEGFCDQLLVHKEQEAGEVDIRCAPLVAATRDL